MDFRNFWNVGKSITLYDFFVIGCTFKSENLGMWEKQPFSLFPVSYLIFVVPQDVEVNVLYYFFELGTCWNSFGHILP